MAGRPRQPQHRPAAAGAGDVRPPALPVLNRQCLHGHAAAAGGKGHIDQLAWEGACRSASGVVWLGLVCLACQLSQCPEPGMPPVNPCEQLMHELAHVAIASLRGIKIAPSYLIPNSQLGTFGSVTQASWPNPVGLG